MLDALWEGFRRHDRLALARLLTLAARGEQAAAIAAATPPPAQPSRVVAFTGSPGVGKSTLIGQLIEHLRAQNLTVAILACDPQSPLSGGALLGDRFRRGGAADDGVFIRSLAAPGGRGAVAERLGLLVRLVEAFGFDVIVVETVGAGQGDTAVRELADVVVLLLQPESGDDLQWEKAGVLEVADVIAVHKADLPGAEQTAAQVRASLDVARQSNVPVLRVSSKSRQGIEGLWQAVAASPLRRGGVTSARDLLVLLQDDLSARFAAAERTRQPEFINLIEDWRRGALTGAQAVSRVSELLLRKKEGPG
jgi:LAO/AO transport system kinase